MIKSEEGRIHEGHRGRMKDKFFEHGAKIFDTYELLEMLLYYAIPYKDVNPTAKHLLSQLGGLEGVLSADRKALTEVKGIGSASARLIELVGRMNELGEQSLGNPQSRSFDDYKQTGRYLVDYFEKHEDMKVVALLLDGRMRLLDMVELTVDSFGSAGVRSRTFIEAALLTSASIIIFASVHRYGPLFMTESEKATSCMVREDLETVGVRVVEHFIVSGSRYMGVDTQGIYRLSSDSPQLIRFLETRKRCGGK